MSVHRPGSGCATAVLSRLLRESLPHHRALFMAIDINEKAAQATLETGAANQVCTLPSICAAVFIKGVRC